MVRLCGATLGLFSFGVTILLGLSAGNPTDVILVRALWAMLIFCVIGLIAGYVAYRVLDEHAIRKHRELFFEDDTDEPDTEPRNDAESGQAGSQPRGVASADRAGATPSETGRVAAGP